MNIFFKYILTFVLLSIILVSCTTKPDYPNEPFIEYISISRTSVDKFDTLWVKLNFTDGDGNLGKDASLSATCKNNCFSAIDSACFDDPFYGAFLIDMRDSCYVFHDLPTFEPSGSVKVVSGELNLNIPPVECKLKDCIGCVQDTLVYQIVVRDVSGNLSNSVFTDTIFINCN